MKRILVVKGPKATGKTTIINTVVQVMLETYTIGNTVTFEPKELTEDCFGVVAMNGKRIGIDTSGEDEQRIDTLVKQDCDVIICACLSEGNRYQHLVSKYPYSNGFLLTSIETKKVLPILVPSVTLAKVSEVKSWVEIL